MSYQDKLNVMIIENSSVAKHHIIKVLDEAINNPLDVLTIHSREEALEAFPHFQPNLVVTDIITPHKDCMAIIKVMKEELTNTFVIAISNLSSEIMQDVIKNGVDVVLGRDNLLEELHTAANLFQERLLAT